MRCERFRHARLDRELGLVAPATEEALDAHLATCVACRELAAVETIVTDGLARLGALEPPPVQVHDRVLASLGALGRPARSPVPAVDLAWAFAVAIGASIALVAGTVAAAPALSGGWEVLRLVGLGVARALGSIGRTSLMILEPLGDPLVRMLRSARAPFDGTSGVVGAQVATLTAFVAIVVLSTWLIGRDLRRSNPVPTEER